jgi:hypothetical protein
MSPLWSDTRLLRFRVPLTPRRRTALLFALLWLLFPLGLLLHEAVSRAGVPFLRWPFVLTLVWTLLSALASGVIVVEFLRQAVRHWTDWSDGKHLKVVLALAAMLFIVQWASLVAAVK